MAKPIASPYPGGASPNVAKGPFFLFFLMMPAFVVLILILLVAMQYKQLRAFVSPQPMELRVVPESRDAQEQVRVKLKAFLAAKPAPGAASGDSAPGDPARGNAGDTLSLGSEEINHLARSSRPLADLKLDYQLDLEDTVLIARNSLPVEKLRGALSTLAKLLRIHGYLNSEMCGYPVFKDGKLIVVPSAAKMNGMAAPVSVLGTRGQLDVRDWVSDKDLYDQAMASLSDLRIRGGKLILIKRK